MKESNFDLQTYLSESVERVTADAVRAALFDPRESAFMIGFAAAARKASKKRLKAEKRGEHIPAFLIASITSSCNLHCAGCYSRCSSATQDTVPVEQLSADEWLRLFREAADLGVSFIILAGGEPTIRPDVIAAAGEVKTILFPVFTNGTFMTGETLHTFRRCRNLVPVISLEGGEAGTDERRGEGVYRRARAAMDMLREQGLAFGVSVTVTSANVREVTSDAFLSDLAETGCRLAVYVEYVPVDAGSDALAPGDTERQLLEAGIHRARSRYNSMMLLSFPGDEKASGGCIAAGRGFFHINSHGDVEPCPFSPYSDTNVRETSLRTALNSRFFSALRDSSMLTDDHAGGCVLHAQREQVERMCEELQEDSQAVSGPAS